MSSLEETLAQHEIEKCYKNSMKYMKNFMKTVLQYHFNTTRGLTEAKLLYRIWYDWAEKPNECMLTMDVNYGIRKVVYEYKQNMSQKQLKVTKRADTCKFAGKTRQVWFTFNRIDPDVTKATTAYGKHKIKRFIFTARKLVENSKEDVYSVIIDFCIDE